MRYTAYFDHPGPAAAVRLEVERAARCLLPRDVETTSMLAFEGTLAGYQLSVRTRLCLEAVTLAQRIYSLIADITPSQPGMSRATLTRLSSIAFQRLVAGLTLVSAPGPNLSVPALYADLAAEALAEERRQAEWREDPVPVEALRRAVAAALRAGRKCRQCNKEGMTAFYFDGTQFIRDHQGEWDEYQAFASEAELLTDLRKFYDWDVRAGTYPHAPLELDVWRFIEGQLA